MCTHKNGVVVERKPIHHTLLWDWDVFISPEGELKFQSYECEEVDSVSDIINIDMDWKLDGELEKQLVQLLLQTKVS
jgi:hypothetical protein